MGEELVLKDRKVGAILAKLGFPRRQRGGDDGSYKLELNNRVKARVHRLIRLSGGWTVELYDNAEPRVMCPLCREYRLVSESDMKWYELELKPAEERRMRKKQEEHEKAIERLRKNRPPYLINWQAAASDESSNSVDGLR
jgi:hypothetical protein